MAAPVPVDAPPSHARLSDRRYVVLVLRLLVDHQDHLIYGEVGGIYEGEAEEHWVSFQGPDGLLDAVQTWLERGPQPPPGPP